jgi:hypothetical protein
MNGDVSEVVPYLAAAATIVYIQKWLKSFGWYSALVQAIPGADKWAHRTVAGVGSFIAAVGIHLSFSGDWTAGWTFHGSIPDGWTLLHASGDWFKVYVLQQYTYDSSRRPEAMHHDISAEDRQAAGGINPTGEV